MVRDSNSTWHVTGTKPVKKPINVRQKNITVIDWAIAVHDQSRIIGMSGTKIDVRRPNRSITNPAVSEPTGDAKLLILAYHEPVLSSMYSESLIFRTWGKKIAV